MWGREISRKLASAASNDTSSRIDEPRLRAADGSRFRLFLFGHRLDDVAAKRRFSVEPIASVHSDCFTWHRVHAQSH